MLGRDQISGLLKEFGDHVRIVDDIRFLQKAQNELADGLKELGDRIRSIETDMKVPKVETKFEALKETQLIVNAVQGGLNQRIENLAVQVASIQNNRHSSALHDNHRRIGPESSIMITDGASSE